jgi:nucleoside-diphosphate-sugar epimerase
VTSADCRDGAETSGRRILVTGATGAIGPRVVEALHRRGCQIRTLALDRPTPGLLPAGVEMRVGSITDAAAVDAAMEGIEAVIHLAALLHINDPPPDARPTFERINVEGTATVVKAASRVGVRRIVFFSTINVYGDSHGRFLTEDSPPHPTTFYAETKLRAERIVLEAISRDGGRLGTVLRMGAIYGARIKGNYRRLVELLARHRFIPVGGGRNRRTLVYDRDVGEAAALAIHHPEAAGRIYNVTDGQVHPIGAIVAAICAALGRRPPRLTLPAAPIRAAAGLAEDMARAIGRHSPIGRTAIEKFLEDVAVDGRRIQAELGFRPKYDLATGWRETIEGMRQAGEI